MLRKTVGVFLLFLIFTINAMPQTGTEASSDIETLKKQIAAMEERLAVQEKLNAEEKETLDSLFAWKLDAVVVLQGADNKNTDGGGSQISPSYLVDFTIGKVFGDIHGEAYGKFRASLGHGLDSALELYSRVNDAGKDNDNDIGIDQIWYKQYIIKEIVSLQMGKLKASSNFDGNAFATDEKTQFLSYMFSNNPAIEFSDRNLGAKISYYPQTWLSVHYGIFDASPNWNDIGCNLFNIGEITLSPQAIKQRGLYRLMVWNNTAAHTEWSDISVKNKATYGFAVSFDQDVSENIGLFGRWGWQDPKVYNPLKTTTDGRNFSLEQSWSFGAEIKGKMFGRENDFIGIAVGQAIASDDYKKAMNAKGDSETHAEAYYNYSMNKHLEITPSVQFIKNPFGNDIDGMKHHIWIGSLRMYFVF